MDLTHAIAEAAAHWVVLSNGRVWRLYDNQIQGVAVDKVVAEAKLEDVEGAEHFLAALSKVVDWLGRHNRLPELPFRGQPGGNRYFLNSTPNHEAEPMRPGYKQLRFGERLAYLDAHRSAEDLVNRVYATCEAAGEPAERFIISLAE